MTILKELKWNVKYDIELLERGELGNDKGVYKNCSLESGFTDTCKQVDFSINLNEDDYENLYEDADDDDFVCITQNDIDKGIVIFTEIENSEKSERIGPRGGRYYYNKKGNKVYIRKTK